jgi:hypothetical protein
MEDRLGCGCRGQEPEPLRKWRLRLARGNDPGDDFQAAKKINGAVGLGEAGVTVG